MAEVLQGWLATAPLLNPPLRFRGREEAGHAVVRTCVAPSLLRDEAEQQTRQIFAAAALAAPSLSQSEGEGWGGVLFASAVVAEVVLANHKRLHTNSAPKHCSIRLQEHPSSILPCAFAQGRRLVMRPLWGAWLRLFRVMKQSSRPSKYSRQRRLQLPPFREAKGRVGEGCFSLQSSSRKLRLPITKSFTPTLRQSTAASARKSTPPQSSPALSRKGGGWSCDRCEARGSVLYLKAPRPTDYPDQSRAWHPTPQPHPHHQ